METDQKPVKELPPGTQFVWCNHLKEYLQITETIVWLNEVPNEIGYHGICVTCGSKYFSRPDGAF